MDLAQFRVVRSFVLNGLYRAYLRRRDSLSLYQRSDWSRQAEHFKRSYGSEGGSGRGNTNKTLGLAGVQQKRPKR